MAWELSKRFTGSGKSGRFSSYHRASKSISNLFVQLDCQICKVFCLFCFQLTICELCVSEVGADILIGWYLGLK